MAFSLKKSPCNQSEIFWGQISLSLIKILRPTDPRNRSYHCNSISIIDLDGLSTVPGRWVVEKKRGFFLPKINKKNTSPPPNFLGGRMVCFFFENRCVFLVVVVVVVNPPPVFFAQKKNLAKVPDVWVLYRVATAPHTKRQIPGEDLFWISIPPAN